MFAVGDGAALGGARVAQARGRLAGLAAGRELGFAARRDVRTERALKQAVAFQDALWRLYRVTPRPVADDTIVCRCEEVTAGRLRAEMAGGSDVLAGVEEGDAGGHGTLPGSFLFRYDSRDVPGCGWG